MWFFFALLGLFLVFAGLNWVVVSVDFFYPFSEIVEYVGDFVYWMSIIFFVIGVYFMLYIVRLVFGKDKRGRR